jgi:hypothetical protein
MTTTILFSDKLNDTNSDEYVAAEAKIIAILPQGTVVNSMTFTSSAATRKRRDAGPTAVVTIDVSIPVAKPSDQPMSDADKAAAKDTVVTGINKAIDSSPDVSGATVTTKTVCDTGYEAIDGYTCRDIDECNTTSPCHTDAACTNTDGSFTCACNQNYNGDGFSCSLCPTEACWNYNITTKTCTMKDECSTLTCGSTQMDIFVKQDVVDRKDNAIWATEAKPAYDATDEDFKLAAGLGEHGMTYSMNYENKTHPTISFHLFVALAIDQQKESNVKEIHLGGMSVRNQGVGVGMSFTCTYPLQITLTSDAYGMHHVEHFGGQIGVGSLSDGFSMSLTNPAGGSSFVMGTDLRVAVDWAITSLPSLMFYYSECNVEHGTVNVPIIKNGCYASITNTRPSANTSSRAAFLFKVFKGLNQEDTEQTITCSVNICQVNNCPAKPKTLKDCPNEKADQPFKYTILN